MLGDRRDSNTMLRLQFRLYLHPLFCVTDMPLSHSGIHQPTGDLTATALVFAGITSKEYKRHATRITAREHLLLNLSCTNLNLFA